MDHTDEAPPPRRWGLTATWLLGIAALLGTVLSGVSRSFGSSGPESTGPGGAVLVFAPPDRTVSVHAADASRIDTVPGILSVHDAVESEGGWVVLDAVAGRIHVVSDDPEQPLRSFARTGEGPGELRQPDAVAVSGSTIGVLEAAGDRLVRYGLDGAVLGPVLLAVATCPFGPGRALLAHPSGGFLVLRSCTGGDGSTRSLLLGVDPEGRVRVVEERRLQSLTTGPVDPFAVPVAGTMDGAAYVGILAEGCLRRVGGGSGRPAPGSLCAPSGPGVPLPDSIRQAFDALGRRMARIGGEVEVPRAWPPFTDVRTGAAGLVLEVPLPGGGEALDLVAADGSRIRFLADAPEAAFVGRRHLLLARSLVVGTELAWVVRDG